MYVNYATWWATMHLCVQNFLIDQNVANVKGGTK